MPDEYSMQPDIFFKLKRWNLKKQKVGQWLLGPGWLREEGDVGQRTQTSR